MNRNWWTLFDGQFTASITTLWIILRLNIVSHAHENIVSKFGGIAIIIWGAGRLFAKIMAILTMLRNLLYSNFHSNYCSVVMLLLTWNGHFQIIQALRNVKMVSRASSFKLRYQCDLWNNLLDLLFYQQHDLGVDKFDFDFKWWKWV